MNGEENFGVCYTLAGACVLMLHDLEFLKIKFP
jgi:hypothetical protein